MCVCVCVYVCVCVGLCVVCVCACPPQVDGRRCVITIGQRTDGGGVLARVFHPASELQYDLTLTPEDLRDSLPEEILGPEHEVDQLNYIRDKCVAPSAPCRRRVLIVCACWCWNSLRMAGPSDCRRVELIPAQGESLNVLLRDRRIVRSWGWSAASEAVDNARAHARRLAARWHTSRSACANAMVSW